MQRGKKSIPNTEQLLSRLDKIEIIMSRLEGKTNVIAANNDDSLNDTLLDRVTALENRLCQLCLDIESSATTAFSNSENASSSHQTKSEPSSSSVPDFTAQKPHKHIQLKESEIQEKLGCNDEVIIKVVAENRGSKNETAKRRDTAMGKKIQLFPKWLTIRKLLGC